MSVFESAKRADLPSLWRQYGLEAKLRSDGRYESARCINCGEGSRKDRVSLFKAANSIWRFNCFSCGAGGTAVDFVATMEGISSYDAARRLARDAGITQALAPAPAAAKVETTTVSRAQRNEAIAEVIAIIKAKAEPEPDTLAALRSRGLSDKVLAEAMEIGLLRTLPGDPNEAYAWLLAKLGRDLLHASGLQQGKWPAAAFRPVVFIAGADCAIEFRTIQAEPQGPKALQYGQQLWPLVWKPNSVDQIMLVEGGIDLLSVKQLELEHPNTLLLGLLGASAWRHEWVAHIAGKYPDCDWLVALDDDPAGDENAATIIGLLESCGVRAHRKVPVLGKDWNELAVAIGGKR